MRKERLNNSCLTVQITPVAATALYRANSPVQLPSPGIYYPRNYEIFSKFAENLSYVQSSRRSNFANICEKSCVIEHTNIIHEVMFSPYWDFFQRPLVTNVLTTFRYIQLHSLAVKVNCV